MSHKLSVADRTFRGDVDAGRERTPTTSSADAFIEAKPVLLDSKIMRTHYSASVMFSQEARAILSSQTWKTSRGTTGEGRRRNLSPA